MPPLDDSLLKEFGRRFIERRDVKAVQFRGGGYTPDRTPWTLADLRAHVEGTKTFGHYLLSQDNKCRLFAYDIDVVKPCAAACGIDHKHTRIIWENESGEKEEVNPRDALLDTEHWARPLIVAQLNMVAEGLASRASRLLDVPVAAAWSGAKGVHVYGFTGSEDAKVVRQAAHMVLGTFGCWEPSRGDNFLRHVDAFECLEIEVFPKQDSLDGKDLGNLMRLPLGVNLKTGKRGSFLRFAPPPTTFKLMEPTDALSGEALRKYWATSGE